MTEPRRAPATDRGPDVETVRGPGPFRGLESPELLGEWLDAFR